MNVWRSTHGFPQQPIVVFFKLPLKLEYVCGTRFRLKNSGDFLIKVRAGPAGTNPVPQWWVPARRTSEAFGKIEFDAPPRGATIQVWFDDQLIASAKGTGAGCL
jgi:hypothetical protein